MNHTADAPNRRLLFWVLAAITLLCLAALPFALHDFKPSHLVLDSRTTTGLRLFAMAALTLPAVLVLSPLLGWFAYRRGADRGAWALALLPLVWVLLLIAGMQV
jgi:hypothetical protein